MADETILNLFISSPGDVQRERERVDAIVERLNAEYAGRARIRTIRWETRYYSSHDTFQAQIPEAADCDLVVAIFGARLGSPLPETFPPMPSGDRYPSGSAYEVLSAIEARRRGQGIPDIYVFRRQQAPLIALDAADREEIESQWRRLTHFFETWFRNRSGQFLAAFQEFGATDEFAAKVEDCLRQWLTRRGFPPSVAKWDRRRLGSPYPGLAAFDESRQAVFFGRSIVVDQALRRLREVESLAGDGERAPFLLMIGASGSGKSSLISAGLMPRVGLPGVLPEVDLWRRAIVVPGLNPFASLAESLLTDEALGAELRTTPFHAREMLAKQLAGDPDVAVAPLSAALDAAAEKRRREAGFETMRPARLFLAIDQTERLLIETPAEAQKRFAVLIAALCRRRIATVLMALRSDAYPLFQNVDDFVALRAAGATLDLPAATASELEEMATRPADICDPPLGFERREGRSLASVLVADAQGGDALPLLQMTLARLSAAEAARGDGVLRFADYHGLGEAVSRTANEVLEKLGAEARGQLPNLIIGLVRDYASDPATGKTVPLIGALDRAHFEAGRPERKALVESFVAHRLLTAEGDAASQRVRPTHESLLRIWPEAVAILADAAQLIRARASIDRIGRDWAEAAPADKARHLEVSPALLESALAYVHRFGEEASPITLDFVAAAAAVAKERRERERREGERRVADAEAIARANRRIARTAGVGLAVAVALAGVAGWQWRASLVAQHEAQAQRDRAERALAAATSTADTLVFDLAQKFRYVAGVPKPIVKDILDQARKLQEQLIGFGESSAKLSADHAAALGESAVTERTLGDAPQALALAEQAAAAYEQLLKKTPDNVAYLYDLTYSIDFAGDVLGQQGKPTEAEAAYKRAQAVIEGATAKAANSPRLRELLIAILEDRGSLARKSNDIHGALALFRQALDIAHDLVGLTPEDVAARNRVAIAQRNVGDAELALNDLEAADRDFSEASKIAAKLAQENPDNSLLRRDYSLSQERLGETLTQKGDFKGALQAFIDGEATAIDMAKSDPANLEWQYDISIGHVEVGDAESALGDAKAAAAAFLEAVTIDAALVVKDPSNADWRKHYDDSLLRLVDALDKSGDSDGAIARCRDRLAFDSKIVEGNPDDPEWRRLTIQAQDRLGALLLAANKGDEALSTFQGAAEKARALAPDRDGRELELRTLAQLAGAEALKDDAVSAVTTYLEAVGLARKIIADNSKDAFARGELTMLLVSASDMQKRLGRLQDAKMGLSDSLKVCMALVKDTNGDAKWQAELATVYDRLGGILAAGGDAAGAIDAYRQSLQVFEALPDAKKSDNALRVGAAMTHEALARLLDARKDYAGALDDVQASRALRRAGAAENAADSTNLRMLMIDDNFSGRLLSLTGKPDDALATYRDGLVIARDLVARPGADATARNDLAISLSQIGLQLAQAKDFTGAAASLTEAMTIAIGLMTEAPSNPARARYAGLIARNLGMTRLSAGDRAGALRAFVAGRDADKAALTLDPANHADADNLKLDVTDIGFAANAMLIAREFEAALAALDEAQPAAPDQNWLDLVRAGALMFLNREDEAKALLMKHRGEKTYSGKIWEAETIDAIARLRAKGLTHPLMDEILAAFSPAH